MDLQFNPDKNKSVSTAAFQTLLDAANFLAYKHKRNYAMSAENIFYKGDFHYTSDSDGNSSTTTPALLSLEQNSYIQKLINVYKHQKMTADDETFFRDILRKHPEFLRLSDEHHNNIFLYVINTQGTSSFFQWLINQPYAEETILYTKDGDSDCFSEAVGKLRYDCLRILFDTYGNDALQYSTLDRALSGYVMMFCADSDSVAIQNFIFDELGYTPQPESISKTLLDMLTFSPDNNIDRFEKLLDQLIAVEWPVDDQCILDTAIQYGRIDTLKRLHARDLISLNKIRPVINHDNRLSRLLYDPIHFKEMVRFLKDKGQILDIFDLNCPSVAVKLLELNIITTEDAIKKCNPASIIYRCLIDPNFERLLVKLLDFKVISFSEVRKEFESRPIFVSVFMRNTRDQEGMFMLLTQLKILNIEEARSLGLTHMNKQLQLYQAESYLFKRALAPDYKTRISFFCLHLNFGCSKKEKATATRALIQYLKSNEPIPESCRPALSQGELGRIAAIGEIKFCIQKPHPHK